MAEGDFVFVPPHMPHVEANMSTTDELVWVTCRTPDNIVVNLGRVSMMRRWRATNGREMVGFKDHL